MGERRNLPAPHAPPKVCLSESKCSHRLAVPAEGYHNTPNWQDGRGCQHGSRSYTRWMGQRGLPVLHTPPKASLSESKCSHRSRRPRRLPGRQNNFLPESRKKKYSPSRAIPFYSPGKGVWGPCPHVYPKPLTFRPKPAVSFHCEGRPHRSFTAKGQARLLLACPQPQCRSYFSKTLAKNWRVLSFLGLPKISWEVPCSAI